jgi:hypothetical protein
MNFDGVSRAQFRLFSWKETVMRYLNLAIAAMLSVMLVNAQSGMPSLRADIPFTFEMRGLSLPAGDYRVDFSADRGYVTVRSQENAAEAAMGLTIGVYPNRAKEIEPKLVFNKYGDRYFLSQVWHPSLVRELPKSKQERELVTSRVVAQNPVRVVVAARLVR